MNPDQLKKIIHGIAGTYKSLQLYPSAHPSIRKQALTLLQDLQQLFPQKHPLKLGLLEGTLFFEDQLYVADEPAIEDIGRLLKERDIEGVEIAVGLTVEELLLFFQLLSDKRLVGLELTKEMKKRGIQNIRPFTPVGEEAKTNQAPGKIYQRALKTVSQIFNDTRLGKIPSSKNAVNIVEDMVQSTLNEPHALMALSLLKDYDNYTFTHSVNVSVIALAVGQACELSVAELNILGLGALLHDIGKLSIDKEIINKPGRLTEDEYAEIQKHPSLGATLTKQMEGLPHEVTDIVLGHHLRYDGQGYPAMVLGKKNSRLADMTAVADSYDAMTTLRPYQRPTTPRGAIEKMRKESGTALDPQILEKLIVSLGPYPVGSLVRLDSNEIALVTRVASREKDAVELKILFCASGEKLDHPIPGALIGNEAQRIVAEVDPFIKGIEVTDYFT
jgi:putative nucleotidyltransferase with HDIG domain